MLSAAENDRFAIGAFNVYNLEGVKAVIGAAEAEESPIMLQLHPGAIHYGGVPLISLCLEAVRQSTIPAVVHLDHSASTADVYTALQAGISSVMIDGSHLEYLQNLAFTRKMSELVHAQEGTVEAELGRLSGTEDNLSVADYEAKLTDPDQAAEFTKMTDIDLLAVCIGNVHGEYRSEPELDFERLEKIHRKVEIPLVLHGASGLPKEMIYQSIELGVRKINVNTEVRKAFLSSLKISSQIPQNPDLIQVMQEAITAMQSVVVDKLRLFGSSHKAYKISLG
jgi:tagatose 1,6-diphosphate aldolase GatY/KbaY